MKVLREKLKKKYKEKVKTLKGRKKKEDFKLPENLDRYSEARIFRSDEELVPEEPKGPVTVGNRAITLSGGEKSVLTRGPKYTLRRILSKENFLCDMTTCFIKERWEARVREERETDLVEMEDEEKQRIEKLNQELEGKSRQIYDE